MHLYEHKYADVEDYLHHRAPYLMVDRIVSINTTEIQTEQTITGDEFFIAGHFPGAPIVPGAMMQELSTQTAGILIAAKYNPMQRYDTHDPQFNEFALGVLVRVKRAKFIGFARPGDTLRVKVVLKEHVDTLFDFSATISVAGCPIMRNVFQLTNVPAAALYGQSV